MLNKKLRISLLQDILLTRLVELEIVKEYPKNEIRCPVHLSIGQEAISAGVSANLKDQDIIYSAHRSHSHYLSKGGSLEAMIAEIYGKELGCVKGLGGSMHLLDIKKGIMGCVPIVGSTISIAAGTALSNKLNNKKVLTVVYFGDGAIEAGVFYETLNFSKIHNLPIIFICENNFYSTFTDYKIRQSKKNNVTNIAKTFGIRSSKSNGNDVEKVYNLALKARKYVLKKQQPFLLEFFTHRVYEHCGPNIDDNLLYRPSSFLNLWSSKCPLESYKKKLINNKVLTEVQYEKIKNITEKKIISIFRKVKNQKFPSKKILNSFIYAK